MAQTRHKLLAFHDTKHTHTHAHARTHAHTHTRLMALFRGLPGWAGTRKVKPIWILLKQETVSGSSISWAICKFAPRSRQITMPPNSPLSFLQAGCLGAAPPTVSKHWRDMMILSNTIKTPFQVKSILYVITELATVMLKSVGKIPQIILVKYST